MASDDVVSEAERSGLVSRVVPDDEDEIVTALNHLRAKYDYVITTGGIGPTHDDITADCVAKAFGVALYEHPEIIAMMESRWKTELNAAIKAIRANGTYKKINDKYFKIDVYGG